MNISEFRSIADMRNALVVLDSRTDEIKVSRQTLIHRTIAWLKAKVSPNPMAGAERDAAHNRFLRAIADHSGYDSGDVSRARALLTVDLLERKPLSSRRVREVIQDLDRRSTPAMRENRTTAAWMSRRGIDMRLAERAPDAAINEEERESLSANVYEAVHSAGRDGARKVDFSQASTITNAIVDAFLDDRSAKAEAAARAQVPVREQAAGRNESARPMEREPGPVETRPQMPAPGAVTDGAGHQAAVQPAGTPTVAAEARTTGDAGAPNRATRKELLRTLGKTEFPGNVKSELKKLVTKGVITDPAGLVNHANRRTADWVMQNRVGRWYGEALKHQGARRKIKHGEELMASETMLRQITDSIVGSTNIQNYPDIKAQSRALIAAHVRSEIDGRNT